MFLPKCKGSSIYVGRKCKLHTNAYENLNPSFRVEFHRGLVSA